jgi:RNA polymerase sigma factor (TIGR02999 family)
MSHQRGELTRLLGQWRNGDREAADQLLAVAYDELRRVARALLRGERQHHTLQATALVHEAYLRLFRDEPVDLESREAFFRLVAAQMRRELIDHARRRDAAKRGGGWARADFEDVVGRIAAPDAESKEQVFDQLETAMRRLEQEYPRVFKVLELRYFAGLSNDEAAAQLGVSRGTVKRDFAFARAWLAKAMEDEGLT